MFASSQSSGISEVSASGGTPKPVTELDRSRRENSHRWPTFLPDGRHFLFFMRCFQPEDAGLYVGSLDSKEYRQQLEVYVTQFPGGGRKYQVSRQGGQAAHWRGDGKELFYFSVPQNSIMAVSVEERGEEVSLGAQRELFPLVNPNTFPVSSMFDVTSDGQRFLISEASFPVSSVRLKLVVNWETELKKK